MKARLRLPPREVASTGDDSPTKTLAGFVMRMTGSWQLAALGLSLASAGLMLAPIEVQRRMIDDAIGGGDAALLLSLGLVYLGVIVAHQAVKFSLGVLQGWLGESATAHMRRHLWRLKGQEKAAEGEGRDIVSVLSREVEALGGFAGAAPSAAMTNAALLVGALGYMFWVQPTVALVGLLLLIPQAALAPVIQVRLNRLVTIQLHLMRRFTAAVGRDKPPSDKALGLSINHLYRNRISVLIWKFLMKSILNLMNAAAPIAVIGVGGWMVIGGQTTLGVVVAFVGGFDRLGDPVRQLIAFYREAAEANVRHRMVASWMTAAAPASVRA